MSELNLLTQAAGSKPVEMILTKRAKPDPALFIGSGKAVEIRELMDELHAEIAIFNHSLSSAQQSNLGRALGLHVFDRTGFILDHFAHRAKSQVGHVLVVLENVYYR